MEATAMGYGPYTIQENGQVTLPKELRREYGLSKGDAVTFERTDAGWVVRKEEPDPMKLLDELGALLAERGITLDELIASGRGIRGEIVRERYGIEAEDDEPDLP
jgi:AbrB family looped-hinge helix DNA binding protein